MLSMNPKRKRQAARDMLVQGVLPFLWPDQSGQLSLSRPFPERSSASGLPRLPRSPRAEVVRASRFQRSQSLSSWLSWKSLGVAGFGRARVSRFETWLSARLESSAFNALELERVITAAVEDLDLDRSEVLRLLVRVTREKARFKSDGKLITWR